MTPAYEIRMHGIGGQGVAVAADILGLAAVKDGRWAHSFPFFGTEIRGGKVAAYIRLSDQPIHTRSFIHNPDLVVAFADYVLGPDILTGFKKDTVLLINTTQALSDLPALPCSALKTIDADGIAASIPGCRIANGPILGAIVAISQRLSLESIIKAIQEKFTPEVASVTSQAARVGFKIACESEGVYGASLV